MADCQQYQLPLAPARVMHGILVYMHLKYGWLWIRSPSGVGRVPQHRVSPKGPRHRLNAIPDRLQGLTEGRASRGHNQEAADDDGGSGRCVRGRGVARSDWLDCL